MPYHIYHTEALILGGLPRGEGDRLLFCYTKELGLVLAHAKSIREGRSKLRYALQTFAHTYIDLVSGKSGWRLISARPVSSFRESWSDGEKRRILARQAQLLRRLIQGEERNEKLFDDVLLGVHFLHTLTEDNDLLEVELLMVVRLLHELGYWGNKEKFAPLFEAGAWHADSLEYIRGIRGELLAEVNESLQSSQL